MYSPAFGPFLPFSFPGVTEDDLLLRKRKKIPFECKQAKESEGAASKA